MTQNLTSGIFEVTPKVRAHITAMTDNLKTAVLPHPFQSTGLLISPSGISDPCGTEAGMVTPKGSMSTERETLQVSVLPYRYSIC